MKSDFNIVLQSIRKIVGWTIFLAAALITPLLSFEPINLAKMGALVVGATATIPLAIFIVVKSRGDVFLNWVLISYLLLQSLVILSFVRSSSTFEQAFWGQFGRNNGALTTSSLITIAFCAYLVSRELGSTWILKITFIGSLPISGYGAMQLIGWDPIPWSQDGVFSTLGNANFASAYFALVTIICAVAIWERIEKGGDIRFYAFWATLNLILTVASSSIQGILMIGIASAILIWFWLLTRGASFLVKSLYLMFVFAGTSFLSLGFFGAGPFNSMRQETLFYRLDYWKAGLKMIESSPLFGIGPDFYGDFYRKFRDIDAVLRTGPERVTNTAHNIFIDLGVSYGAFFGICFFALFMVIIFLKIFHLSKSFGGDRNFSDLSVCLVVLAYFAQANISINQIALATTGWAFLGALLGDIKNPKNSSQESRKQKKLRAESRQKKELGEVLLPPGLFVPALTFGLLGFLLILPPFKSDARFNTAIKANNLDKLLPASRDLGITSVHKEVTLDRMKQLAPQVQTVYAKEILAKYPRNFYTWQVLYSLPEIADSEKTIAIKSMQRLDPLNQQLRIEE